MTPGVADASFHLVDPGIERLSVVGLGYIGLPTAAMFAHAGLSVVGVDVNSRTVGIVNAGSAHIKENGLEEILADTVSAGRLRATLRAEPADAFIIAVPTPVQHDHSPDLSHVEAASRLIAPVLKKGDLIILESTCPVGTTRRLAGLLAAERPDLEFPDGTGAADVCLAYCPERVIPGRMLEELVENDRIVGGIMPCCAERAARLYGTFVRGQCLITDDRTAEMVKLAENTFRDVNIAFANELSVICDRLDIDVWELIRLANHHPRVKILQPGSGVGGHCIAVDPWFIVDSAAAEARLIRTAREVNDAKPEWVVQQVCEATERLQHAAHGKRESDIKIALLGLAFKPNVGDLRESPALNIANSLVGRLGCRFLVAEPNISEVPESLAGHRLCTTEEAVEAADIVVVLVAHKEFSNLSEKLSTHQSVLDPVGITSS